jgi:hypothetical protein
MPQTERHPKLVLVEWYDSHGSSGWEDIDGDAPDEPLVCRSVGWLMLDGTKVKVVAPHLTMDDEARRTDRQTFGCLTIPACAIKTMTTIAEPKTLTRKR